MESMRDSLQTVHKTLLTVLETVDLLLQGKTEEAMRKELVDKTQSFVIRLFEITQLSQNEHLNSLVFVLLNAEFVGLKSTFPLSVIKRGLASSKKARPLSEMAFPSSPNQLQSTDLFSVLTLRVELMQKDFQRDEVRQLLTAIVGMSNSIHSLQKVTFCQFEFIRMCVLLVFAAERRMDLLQESTFEGFVSMCFRKLVEAYLRSPSVHFASIASTVTAVSGLVRKTFHKDSVQQAFYKMSLRLFKVHSQLMTLPTPKVSRSALKSEVCSLCDLALVELTQLHNFDVFFSNEDTFLRSSLCKFASNLVFLILEEYNLLISLPSVDPSRYACAEEKRQSVMFRNDNRIEFLTYVLYLQKVASVCKSIDLNLYLEGQLSGNFSIGFLTEWINAHSIENGQVYLQVS